jgi:hypothetical protein
MFLKLFFTQMSLSSQVKFMKRKGIQLGTRLKDGRHIYTYMFRNLFAEVLYKNDNPDEPAERIYLLSGLNNLSVHLENEMKTRFKN